MLNKELEENCFSTVEYFQLKSINLPDPYEKAIQHTEVMKQDIHKANAEKNKMKIELETKVKKTEIASHIKVVNANGTAQAMVNKNVAEMTSFYKVQKSQAKALGEVKEALKLNDK